MNAGKKQGEDVPDVSIYEWIEIRAVYDPAGYWIEQEFAAQLRTYGVEVGAAHSIIKPDLLPAELLDIYKYRLRMSARTKNWMETTGGINGESYGLEADSLGGEKSTRSF